MIFKRKKITALEKHLQNIHSPEGVSQDYVTNTSAQASSLKTGERSSELHYIKE